MKLPNAEDVQVDEGKIRGYLLSRSHPVGRFKARVFAALGFDENSTVAFAAELRRIAATGEVAEQEENAFGRKYTVPGELKGPTGSARVVTVWFQAAGEQHVRLVTVHPR
ncbi:MAG: DUF6883 domain-containing protein [Vicinamibacteria bacterium]